jgi:hypothetical protein
VSVVALVLVRERARFTAAAALFADAVDLLVDIDIDRVGIVA